MLCELCGREYPTLRSTKVEGSVLMVCGACARFGEGVAVQQREGDSSAAAPLVERLALREKRMQEKDIYESAGGEMLVEDFPQRIKRKRESLGMSQDDLAKKLNERRSIIQKLETGDMTPDDKLAKKLEGALGIKLKEKVAPSGVSQVKKSESRGLTLGDLIKFEKD
jgi:putative transcription factor